MKLKRIAGWALMALSGVGLYCTFMACWVFRDGMGPDAVESHGRVAAERLLEDFWRAAVILIPVWATGFWLAFAKKGEQVQPLVPTRENGT